MGGKGYEKEIKSLKDQVKNLDNKNTSYQDLISKNKEESIAKEQEFKKMLEEEKGRNNSIYQELQEKSNLVLDLQNQQEKEKKQEIEKYEKKLKEQEDQFKK